MINRQKEQNKFTREKNKNKKNCTSLLVTNNNNNK